MAVVKKSTDQNLNQFSHAELGAGPATSVRVSEPQRRVLDAMAAIGEPCTIHQIAAEMHVHPNTVRTNLNALQQMKHVAKANGSRNTRGRPSDLYSLQVNPFTLSTDKTEIEPMVQEYVNLTGAFAEYLSRSQRNPRAEAKVIGRSWGRSLLRKDQKPRPRTARAAILRLLTTLGFSPKASKVPAEREEGLIRLYTCPLIAEARKRPEVICQIHAGVVEGALSTLKHPSDGLSLTPFAEPGACHLRIPTLNPDQD